MRLALPITCIMRHVFYRESGTTTECPYCLRAKLTFALDTLARIQGTLRSLAEIDSPK